MAQPPRIHFETDPGRFAALIADRTGSAPTVLVDADNAPASIRQIFTHEWALKAELEAAEPDVMVDVRSAETLAATEQAQLLSRERPLRVLVAECRTHFQAQFVVEMAARSLDVTVYVDRRAFLALVDDRDAALKYIGEIA